VCTFVYNIHKIVKYNISKMAIIYSIFLIGFSQSKRTRLNLKQSEIKSNHVSICVAFFLIMLFCNQNIEDLENRTFESPLQSLMDTFILTLGEVGVDFEAQPSVTVYSVAGEILFTVYLIVGSVLLINMLIAMMDNTQEDTNEMENEWIRQV
jgi:hypothetical protein